MQNSPYQHLAKEFMDLWQKQISAVISDKQFIQAMLEMFQSVQKPSSNDRTAQPSHPAPASDADHGVLAELAFRVAMCEKRLSILEQRSPKSASAKPVRKRAGGGSKKPRQ